MSFLSALGAFGSGFTEGMGQGSQVDLNFLYGQQMRQKMAEQSAVDAATKLAGTFTGLQGGQAAPPGVPAPTNLAPPVPQMTQPVGPGVSSMPAGGPPASMPPPQIAPPGGVPTAAALPSGPTAGNLQGPPPPDQGQGLPDQGQVNALDPMAAVKVVGTVINRLKELNPNAPPDVLFDAAQQIIGVSKGIDPAIRAQTPIIIERMKQAAPDANTVARVGATDRATQQRGEAAVARNVTQNRAIDASIERAGIMVKGAMDRAAMIQQATNSRFNAGQMNKAQMQAVQERLRTLGQQLGVAQRELASYKNTVTGQIDPSDPRVVATEKKIADVSKKLDILAQNTGIDAQQAGGGEPGGAPSAQKHAPGPAPATLKGKPIWPSADGKSWVYDDGTEAK